MPRVLLILGVASLLIAAAQAPDPGPPAWVEVDPNAIESSNQPMRIDVGGIPQGQTVTLQVLQDCNGDHRPDLQGQGDCKSPLYARDSSKADSRNMVEDYLDFAALEKSGTPLPRNRADPARSAAMRLNYAACNGAPTPRRRKPDSLLDSAVDITRFCTSRAGDRRAEAQIASPDRRGRTGPHVQTTHISRMLP